MRRLQTHDVFVAAKLVKTIGIRNEVKAMALKVSQGEKMSVEEVGIEFFLNIIEGASSEEAEKGVYELLGGIMEIEPDALKTMDALEFVEKMKELATVIDAESWKAFFNSVATLMK